MRFLIPMLLVLTLSGCLSPYFVGMQVVTRTVEATKDCRPYEEDCYR